MSGLDVGAELGVAVFGVSRDKPPAQQRFDDTHGFGFPLIAEGHADEALAGLRAHAGRS